MATKKKKVTTYKVGRDAATGRFIPVKVAKKRKTAIVETVKRKTSQRIVTRLKPIHTTSGVSGAEIINSFSIKKSDVKAAKKLITRKHSKPKKTSQKK